MRPSLLWIDSRAGLAVGIIVLAFAAWFSRLYALPVEVVIGIGLANLGFGLFSYSLWRRPHRPRALIRVLVVANASWAVLSAVAVVVAAPCASPFGLAHLLGECLFVGGLAILEWRNRESLLVAA